MPSVDSTAQTAPLSQRVLTVQETAAHLRISRVTLYKLFGEGRIKPTKIGARTLIRGHEIERFLNAAESK